MDGTKKFLCAYCKQYISLSNHDAQCPYCFMPITFALCPQCGYTAPIKNFAHGCPSCGYLKSFKIKGRTKQTRAPSKKKSFFSYRRLLISNVGLILVILFFLFLFNSAP